MNNYILKDGTVVPLNKDTKTIQVRLDELEKNYELVLEKYRWRDIDKDQPYIEHKDPYREYQVFVLNTKSKYTYQDVLGFDPYLFKFFTDKDHCVVTHWMPTIPEPAA